jgi:hypothetical protein
MVDEFDQFVLKSMPHFMAVEYQRFLDAEPAQEKIVHALHMYELGLRALAMGVISQYLIRDAQRVSDPALNQLLLTKLPTATLDTWQRILFATLRAYEGQRNLFFMPELYDFFWDRSTTPHQPRPDIDAPFTRLAQIRNDLEHGTPPADDAGWQALCDETLGLLRTVLSQFVFFENYDLIRITKRDGDQYWYDCYSGLQVVSAPTPLQTQHELGPGWFYLSKQNRDFLKLHPLLVFWEEPSFELTAVPSQGDTAVYDRFIRDRLQYLITSLWTTVTDENSVADFVRLLYYTIEQVKREQQEAERLTWWQLQEIARAISQRRMAGVLGKYRSDLYLQRGKTKEAFQDFLASDKVCFILTGKSGVGKSNFLLALTEEYAWEPSSDVCLLMYNGAKLSSQEPLTVIVGRDFDNYLQLTGRGDEESIANIWREIALVDGMENRKVVLCIDAINENAEAKDLLRQIDELVEVSPWPWLKVVITSRPEAWRAIKRGVRLAEARYYREKGEERLGVEMEPFSYSQELKPFTRDELPFAYEKYREVYDLRTAYADLLSGVKTVLQDPLVLRLVADVHQGQEIPSTVKVGEIYQEYINHLIRTERLTVSDLHFLERELMPIMIGEGHYANAITSQEIDDASTADGRSLFELIHNDGVLSSGQRINQSYINLVDTEVLVRHGEGQQYEIGFKFERFYDYYAGKRIRKLVDGKAKEVEKAYTDLAGEIEKHPYLWGAMTSALLAELKEGNHELATALCQTEDQTVKEIMVVTLTDYGVEEPQKTESLLEELMQMGKGSVTRKADSSLLSSLLQRILQRENVELPRRILNAQKIAIEVAGNLGSIRILQEGAMGHSATVRTHAVRHIIHLWRKDREQLQASTSGNRGFEVLQNLSGHIRKGLLPNINALEAGFGVLLSIFFDCYHNTHGKKEAELLDELRRISKKGLEDLLYINEQGLAKAMIRNRIREWVISRGIRFALRWVRDTPEFNTSDIINLSTFFELPPSDKEFLRLFLPYYDPARKDIEALESHLPRVLHLNDTIVNWTLWQIMLVQWDSNKEAVLRMIRYLFEEGMKQPVPTYSTTVSLSVLAAVLRQRRGDESIGELYRELFSRYLEKSGGTVTFSGRTYVSSWFAQCFDATYGLRNQVDPTLPCAYMKRAVQEGNVDFLRAAINDLGGLVPEKRYHKPILEVVQPLLSRREPLLHDATINLLSRLRQYCPNQVDDLLLEHNWSTEDRRSVKTQEVTETIGGDILFLPLYRYIADAAVFSRQMQQAIPWTLERAIDSSNVSQWLNIFAKKVLNLAYGEDIFRLD